MWLNVLFHFPILGLSVSSSIGALQPTTTWKACFCEATSLRNPMDAAPSCYHQLSIIDSSWGFMFLVTGRSPWSVLSTTRWRPLRFFYLAALCCWWFGPQMLPLRNRCMSLADVSYLKALLSSISSASGIGVPAWWDVKACRHLVSTSEQVRELKITLMIIFGFIQYFWKGQRWQLGIIGIHLWTLEEIFKRFDWLLLVSVLLTCSLKIELPACKACRVCRRACTHAHGRRQSAGVSWSSITGFPTTLPLSHLEAKPDNLTHFCKYNRHLTLGKHNQNPSNIFSWLSDWRGHRSQQVCAPKWYTVLSWHQRPQHRHIARTYI